jgi:hypothetical protein
MKDLVPIGNEKKDAFSRILRFYDKADIVLTAEEEQIHSRWIYCDALLRSRRHKTEEIIEKICEKFSPLSKFTAQNDIKNTYALFAAARQISKRYVLQNSIENIQLDIERFKNDKSLVYLLPKLYAELTRASNALPDEIPNNNVPQTIVYIGTVVNNTTVNNLPIEQARERWKQIKASRKKDDYIDHQDVNDDN